MSTETDIHTLHRYFIWANRMREHFYQTIESQGPPPSSNKLSEYQHWLIGPFTYISYWFAALHVVCEGWKILKLSDKRVDTLLTSEYLNLLRRYRNGVFHYQKTYFDKRFTDFMGIGNEKTKRSDNGYKAGKWADHLHTAFREFFLKRYKLQGFEWTIDEVENGKFELAIKKKTNKRKMVKAIWTYIPMEGKMIYEGLQGNIQGQGRPDKRVR